MALARETLVARAGKSTERNEGDSERLRASLKGRDARCHMSHCPRDLQARLPFDQTVQPDRNDMQKQGIPTKDGENVETYKNQASTQNKVRSASTNMVKDSIIIG